MELNRRYMPLPGISAGIFVITGRDSIQGPIGL